MKCHFWVLKSYGLLYFCFFKFVDFFTVLKPVPDSQMQVNGQIAFIFEISGFFRKGVPVTQTNSGFIGEVVAEVPPYSPGGYYGDVTYHPHIFIVGDYKPVGVIACF